MTKITVDFTRNVGAMKPVHAIGQPPNSIILLTIR